MKTILIAGATGLIGSAFINTFYNQYKVILITRDTSKFLAKKNRINLYTWKEFEDNKTTIIKQADYVINLAGEPILKLFTNKHKKRLYNSRINSTKVLVEAINQASKKPACFINASAIGFYDHQPSIQTYTELNEAGRDFISHLCKEWESEASKASIRSVQLRIGLVLANNKGFLKSLLPPFRAFIGGHLGNGKQACPWIHIDDVVKIIHFIIEKKAISGPVNLTSPAACDLKTFCNAISQCIKRPSWLHIPSFVIKLLFGDLAPTLLHTPFVKPEKLLNHNYTFTHTDLQKTLDHTLKNR